MATINQSRYWASIVLIAVSFLLSRLSLSHCCSIWDDREGEDVNNSEEHDEHFRVSRTLNSTAREGESISLSCNITGYDEYPRVWRKCRRVLAAGDLLLTRGHTDDQQLLVTADKQLIIHQLKPEHSGSYTCSISTEPPRQYTHFLTIHYKPRIKLQPVIGASVILVRSSNITITCLVDAIPSATVQWSKVLSDQDRDPVLVHHRNLTLVSAQVSDDAVYQCTASNMLGMAQQKVRVHVQYAPEVSVEKSTVHVKVGDTVHLRCYVFANPTAKVFWTRKNSLNDTCCRHDVASDTGLGTRHVAIIRHVQPADFDTYTCHALNKHGSSAVSVIITGVPLSPVFLGARSSGNLGSKSRQLHWSVISHSDVMQYKLLFGAFSGNHMEGVSSPVEWREITVPAPAGGYHRGSIYNSSIIMHHLQSNSEFRLRLQARNMFGWSALSRQYSFNTTNTQITEKVSEQSNYRTTQLVGRSRSSASGTPLSLFTCFIAASAPLLFSACHI